MAGHINDFQRIFYQIISSQKQKFMIIALDLYFCDIYHIQTRQSDDE